MKKMLSAAVLSAMALSTLGAAVPASAKSHHRHSTRTYRGNDGYYSHRCHGGSGTTGTIVGGVGGALVGHAVGGGTLGTVAGGVGGGLLGRHIDKANTRHRRGC